MSLMCQWQFLVTHDGRRDEISARVSAVMDALLDLESVDARLTNSAVSLDLTAMTVTVEISVAGIDYDESIAHALAAIRTAIHAAGGSTPDWPSDGPSPSMFEPQDFVAVPA